MAVEVTPSVEVRKKLTPDDVTAMIERGELDTHERWFELIEGEIVDVPPESGDANSAELNIGAPLWDFARRSGGKVFLASAGFLVGRDHQ
jgi:Uma2 family endonuclease